MKQKHIILSILCGISLLFFAVMTLIAESIENSLPDQHAPDRWTDGSSPYAQVSVFTDAASALTIDGIFAARIDIDKKLIENSITSEKQGARLWADAFSSSQRKIAVSTEYGSAEAVTIATGGDFFLFHPVEIISGYYYSDDDLMQDRVLIDEVLAWQLYGSSNIAGKPVIINGKYFYISGVFRQSDNPDMEKTYGTAPRMFISHEGYELIGNGAAGFTCYEACLPNTVSGLGMKIITETIPIDEASSVTIENSKRYGLKNRFGIISDFGTRSVVDTAVAYPYWENAARITEDKSALLLVMQIIGLVLPVSTVVYVFVLLYRKRKIFFSKAVTAVKCVSDKQIAKIKNRSFNHTMANRKEGVPK